MKHQFLCSVQCIDCSELVEQRHVPQRFETHEQLSPDEVTAWLAQGENFSPPWERVLFTVLSHLTYISEAEPPTAYKSSFLGCCRLTTSTLTLPMNFLVLTCCQSNNIGTLSNIIQVYHFY